MFLTTIKTPKGMMSIVLIEPEHPSNIGAVARVMANFGFSDLVLINPKCNHLDAEAILRAKHSAAKILKSARVEDFSYLKKFDYLIGTSAILGTDYNVPRSPLTPEELAEKLNGVNRKIAIVFGREGIGLRKKEIEACDFIVTIPTDEKYATMNISHSAAVVLYELHKLKSNRIREKIVYAGKKDKEIVLKLVNELIDGMEFATKEKRETQRKVWKRIVGKSMMTKREAFALCGFFKKLRS